VNVEIKRIHNPHRNMRDPSIAFSILPGGQETAHVAVRKQLRSVRHDTLQVWCVYAW
jgi:hypothetical protein